MDLNLTEEQDMIVGMVRRFVREEIIPLEMDLDPDADELKPEDHERLVENPGHGSVWSGHSTCLRRAGCGPGHPHVVGH